MPGFRSGVPFGNQAESRAAALDRLGPFSPTVGGANVSVGAGVKAKVRRFQKQAQSDYRSEFSRMRQEAPGFVDEWRNKALGGRAFAEDFIPPGGDPVAEDSVAAKTKPLGEEKV